MFSKKRIHWAGGYQPVGPYCSVYLGRFQPFHIAHEQVLRSCLAYGRVLVVVGSAFKEPTPKNPFTFAFRRRMILSCFTAEERRHIRVLPMVDYPDKDRVWAQEVVKLVQNNIRKGEQIIHPGCRKDSSAYYFDLFPENWQEIEVPIIGDFSASLIREIYFHHTKTDWWKGLVPKPVRKLLEDFQKTERYKILSQIHNFDRTPEELAKK